jgi:amidase
MDDLLRQPALAQSAAVRAGRVSVTELTAAYLARIEAREPLVNAFVEVRPERAMAQARALDGKRRDPARGPLWGLPTGLKDLHLTAGFYARMGTTALRHLWSPVDDLTSRAVRRAGMVIVGKLTTSELGILPYVETTLGPPTTNPHDPTRTAGGSSGGSAAAVAAGMLPLAPGSDGGGSIRIPASFCGLVGHKPTRGLVPNPMDPLDVVGISTIGGLTRTVDDTAALLELLIGRPGLAAAVRRPPRPLRVRFTTHTNLVATDPAVVAAVHRAAAALEALGHHVEEGPGVVGEVDEFLPIFQHLSARARLPFAHLLQPTSQWMRAQGRGVTRARAEAARDALTARVHTMLAPVDVWLTPTVAVPPPAIGWLDDAAPAERFYRAAVLGAFTAPLNASGMPATSVPVPGPGLPIGVQLIGRRGDDARLLALAATLLTAWGS